MKNWIAILFLGIGFLANAQKVTSNGVTYKVKGEVILKDNVDITKTLTTEEQAEIRTLLAKKLKTEENTKKALQLEKAQKKAEKAQKQAEKKQKRAEKELKQKQKAQNNFEKTSSKHLQALEKYKKLKKKGKLSPADESKWLEKIEKLKTAHQKAEIKLKRS